MQPVKSTLHRTFGKTRFLRNYAQTCPDRPPALTGGAAIKKYKDEKRGRLLIMPDKVTHEDIQNVIVNRDGLSKTRHALLLPLYR